MTNAVETLEKLERRLTVSFSGDKVREEVEKRLKIQARTAKAPGFRPGKVPMKILERQYGPQIQEEVVNEAVSRAYTSAIEEHNLRVAGYPRFEPKAGGVPDGDVAFSATFEVYPDVQVGDLSGLQIEKVGADVTEKEINRTLDVLRKRQAHYHVRGEQSEHGDGGGGDTAQDSDRLTLDFVGKIDGVEFDGGKATDFVFVLGEGQMLPEFENAARGMKVGETKTFDLSFPENDLGTD
ncbi:MAG: trigger factor, partial [Burkholderiaceae bacterium]|nr:trigger factor [Burkholderiaceae bacterium]